LALVPAHDPSANELARRLDLAPRNVIGDDAVVDAPGPLHGLARFAAKAAARALLEEQGSIVDAGTASEAVRRCRRCGTVLLPRLGRHWFLEVGDLEAAAADAVRSGDVTFTPPAAREEFLERAGHGGSWCLSLQVWGGQPVPIASCVDCGRAAVGVDAAESCGKCMGTLVADDSVLDARFVAALWPLTEAGWPVHESAAIEAAASTRLLVGPAGLSRWALPMAALALRLTGTLPFASVTVTPVETLPDEAELAAPRELTELVGSEGAPVVRLALAAGDLDFDAARHLAACLEDPPEGDADVDALVEAYDGALAAGTPWLALRLLSAALDAGVRPGAADRIRALAAPFLAG
jgi:valyl-tRNA synthetase